MTKSSSICIVPNIPNEGSRNLSPSIGSLMLAAIADSRHKDELSTTERFVRKLATIHSYIASWLYDKQSALLFMM